MTPLTRIVLHPRPRPYPAARREHLLSTLLCLLPAFLLLAPPAPASGQTILNVERFHSGEIRGTHAAITLSGKGTLGNSEVLDAKMEGIVGHRFARHWPRLILGGSYLRKRGEEPLFDNRFIQARYSYIVSERTEAFNFVQSQRNETLRLKERWLVGSGIRRQFGSGDGLSLNLGTGAMWELEEVTDDAVAPGEDPRSSVIRMSNIIVVRHDFSEGARLVGTTYLQPRLDALHDFRLLSELALLVPVTTRVRLTVSTDWRHDSRPPPSLRADDFTLNFGIAYTLN
jgi:hypothetical protein